ncbi:MBL fold metallo-hydrolase [Rubritalea tangerina]|uniref:MBL fold metallo-hydrolase n=1 Tax=Rubritalea tangerina TaxID=430798 RepID=A0ABW4Z6J7_9BACT
MPIFSYTGGHVFTNGYIINHNDTCIVVDAPALINEVIQQEKLTPTHLLLTHQHFDHVEDVEALQKLGVEVLMHSPYSERLVRQKEARENWGLPIQITPFTPDTLLSEQENYTIGNLEFTISHIPGHSPDSICFYFPELEAVFVGDTLMNESLGRTDLPGGSHQQLVTGIHQKLLTLPQNTVVCPGHGPQTTVAHEKEHNQFL